jgi:ATP adenylyltransferase
MYKGIFMDNLYAPWRKEYIEKNAERNKECIFCKISNSPKEDNSHHVLLRSKHCFLVMNRYPYTQGHFLIIPYQHSSSLQDLSIEIWKEMMEYAYKGVSYLKDTFQAQGVNMGLNIGKAAGAGIEDHLHYHLLPRWERDTNFITVTGNSRVYSSNFDDNFKKLKKTIKDSISSK